MKRIVYLFFGILILGSSTYNPVRALYNQDQVENSLVLLKTIKVGGYPTAILVDSDTGRNDILFYSSDKVRFIDGGSLALAAEEISLPTSEWEGWMVYDRTLHQAYVITTRSRETDLRVRWEEVRVDIIASRTHLGGFSVNEGYNSDPLNPADGKYAVEGLALKQPHSEGDNAARLIIDDTANGNIDVVDLDSSGTTAARRQRYSYREALLGSWQNNQGNSLALETSHETLSTDDLTNTDIIYIADLNRKHPDGYYLQGYLRTLQINHPLQDLNAVSLPDVNLTGSWPFSNGNQGLAMAGPRDRLYVASGLQSFDDGYLGEVDTTTNIIAQVVTLTYVDPGFALVDWQDPRRVFVATFDGWYNDPFQALYLHLIYDGAIVDTLRLVDNYDESNGIRGMDFDPHTRRVYLTIGEDVMVVEVDQGSDPPPVGTEPPPAASMWIYLPLVLR